MRKSGSFLEWLWWALKDRLDLATRNGGVASKRDSKGLEIEKHGTCMLNSGWVCQREETRSQCDDGPGRARWHHFLRQQGATGALILGKWHCQDHSLESSGSSVVTTPEWGKWRQGDL